MQMGIKWTNKHPNNKVDSMLMAQHIGESWHKFATNHVINIWQNEPCILAASKAHIPKMQLSHVHIVVLFYVTLIIMNYINFYSTKYLSYICDMSKLKTYKANNKGKP